MSEQTPDLVTKLDVIPDLDGLNSFDAAIERAISKVNQLDAAIKRVNNLKPASPYAPAASTAPTAATAAAVATVATVGANLVSRTPLADTVRKEAQKVASAVADGTLRGVSDKVSIPLSNRYLPPRRSDFGGFLPPPGGGSTPPGGGWSAGRAGGLVDPQTLRRNPFAHLDTSPANFSGEPLEAKKKPVADGVQRATRNPFGVDNMLAGAGLTAGIVAAGNALADSLDAIQRQQAQIARLKQTTGSATDAFFALNAAASEVKSDSGAFISTYTNMATATEKLGLSQEETIKATQGLVGALQLGGAETHTINDALYQMGQAFSSDRFGGDEFRSFMEAIGTMAPKVAEAFGTDVKGLREMSQAGKLTSEVMVKAFQKIAATNMDLLKKQGWTWGQTTTVMKNDWQAFLAQATIGGEWQRFTDWAANTLIPLARGAEKELAAFWSSLADESKAAILVGILGAVGAAFTALAIPVLAALWPFLAIGAAVWLVYEAFVEWKAWMNGEGGTIFDGLFGSFDEFEKRYPKVVAMLKFLKNTAEGTATAISTVAGVEESEQADIKKPFSNMWMLGNTDLGFLTTLASVIGLFGENGGAVDAKSSLVSAKAGGQANISNSGNTTTTINVNSAKDAADTVNNMDNPGTINGGVSGNVAELTGAR